MKSEVTLRKSLNLSQVVYMGLAWMTPMIYFSIYGIAYENAHGMLTQAYLLAFVAIFFTAYSYGVMSKSFPTSGSAYTYTKKSIHPYLGFLVGWALLLDYFFSPIIACLTFGIYLHAQFPSIPAYVWIIGLNIVLGIVNIIGIKFSANISKLFVWIQILFIAVFCFFLFRNITGDVHPLQPFLQTEVPFSTILAGASMICFSFLGFDTVTTMSEETKNSEKTIPRAIMIIIITASILYLVPSFLTQLVYPQLTFVDIDSAGFEIVKLVGGAALSSVFITVLILAIFTQGLSSVTSVSRLLFVMGRDSVLPKRVFGSLHPKFNTPVTNIVIVSVVSLLALVISLDNAVKFVNFGALTAFFFVNISGIAQKYIKDKQRSPKMTFLYLIMPLIGAGFIGYLLSLLDKDALWMGGVWLLAGMVYHLIRKRSARTLTVASRPIITSSGRPSGSLE
ncbi:APC family permease [Paenibacillus alginolyticus]|uniref:APC family permease n=1 Tax=Paenibacillus alginolyticus TaxID=59839 RepID=A0ABT4G9Q8_9BACL|nr:APC family permease [Paenibacillus alginolyticus]MCY9692926.1 APC family permease [Paenibacillus alginolyticus]MEC0144336.1 APC family permease [Paenibacillus alginolyticus]